MWLVVPGAVLIWTYRHFTKSERSMGEFEYAAWSFIWGLVLYLFTLLMIIITGHGVPAPPANDVAAQLGSVMGIGIGIIIGAALPMGFFGAVVANAGLFKWVDSLLMKLANSLQGALFKTSQGNRNSNEL